MRLSLNLLPVDEKFFDNLLAQADMVRQSTELVAQLFANWTPDSPLLGTLAELDEKCDQLRHHVANRVNETLVTPIDRENIYALTTHFDDLLTTVHQVALLIQVFDIKEVTEEGKHLASFLSQVGTILGQMTERLPKLKDCDQLRKRTQILEREAYDVYRRALSSLFRGGHDPLYVYQWKDLYDALENSITECRKACDAVEGTIIKHA